MEIEAGVLPEVGVREIGLLASAADRPRTTVFGEDAYPDLVYTVDDAEAMVLALASGDIDVPKLTHWIRTHAESPR